jgi:hypothetical protein
LDGKQLKVYSLVGKKLVESTPEEIMESSIGMIVDEEEEIIRLILKPDARKKQREVLVEQSAEFNKKEFAGTYLVSHLENPSIIQSFLSAINEAQSKEAAPKKEDKKTKEKKEKQSKKRTKTDSKETSEKEESNILQRWDPELVKKVVTYLDGKKTVSLKDLEKYLDTTEGEAYWLTQDLIHTGILPGRWTGYRDGQTEEWVYQILKEQPMSKKPKKTPSKKSKTKKKFTAKSKKTDSKKKPADKKSDEKKSDSKKKTSSKSKKSTGKKKK